MRSNLFIVPVFLIVVVSCHNPKEVQTEIVPVVSADTTASDGDGTIALTLNYTGTVRDMSKSDGCGWMIELDLGNGEKQLLEPLTLDDAYQVDGKIIEFSYTDSRRQSLCSLPSKPITIDNIIK